MVVREAPVSFPDKPCLRMETGGRPKINYLSQNRKCIYLQNIYVGRIEPLRLSYAIGFEPAGGPSNRFSCPWALKLRLVKKSFSLDFKTKVKILMLFDGLVVL